LFALWAPALGAPSGDEYLPQVPSATGDKPVSEDDPLSPGGAASSTGEGKDEGKNGKDDEKTGEGSDDESSSALASGDGSDDDSSGGVLDTLLDPIVLLLIAGVLAVAIGMILARRHGGEDEGPGSSSNSGTAPPTPDGEIVGQERP
jgi:hypothetical protein